MRSAKCKEYVASLPIALPESIVEVACRHDAAASDRMMFMTYHVGANDMFIYVANLGCGMRHVAFPPDRVLRKVMRTGTGAVCHPRWPPSATDNLSVPTLRTKDETAICIRFELLEGQRQSIFANIDDFLDNVGLREAITSGHGRACRCGSTCTAPSTCPALHFSHSKSTASGVLGRCSGTVGLVKKHTPSLLRDTILVIEERKHFSVDCFFPNTGLQTALRFGRGKLCRVPGASCPDIQRCPRLHFVRLNDEGGTETPIDNKLRGPSTKPIGSVFVRNLYRRANVWDFVDDAGLQLAMSVGEGSVCVGHDGHAVCTLLHLAHFRSLRDLSRYRYLRDLITFASLHGLGSIVSILRGTNSLITIEEFESQRRLVEHAYQLQFGTSLSLAHVLLRAVVVQSDIAVQAV